MSRLYEVSRGLINTVNHSHTAGAGREDGDDLHDSIREPIPFNFTCLQEKWAGRGGILSTDVYSRILGPGIPLDTKYPWGCDGGPDWSCDFKFETTLRKVGFVGVSDGFHMPLSSFTQGCANDFFPDFHITSETAWRPRLHVGFCSNLDEIQGTSFTYDGPLGGGNDYVRRHAVNGWMINHKSEINFYEAYRDKEACRKSDTFVQSCDEALVASMIKKKKQKVSHIVFKYYDFNPCNILFFITGRSINSAGGWLCVRRRSPAILRGAAFSAQLSGSPNAANVPVFVFMCECVSVYVCVSEC